MTKSNLRQRDLERIFGAALAIGASVQIDLKTLVVTVSPVTPTEVESAHVPAPFGAENSEDVVSPISPPFDGRELKAMEALFKMPDGSWTSASTIRSFGPHSQEKLLKRGFIRTVTWREYTDEERYQDHWERQNRMGQISAVH
ncbi:hypothetical protein [Agrobacterium pusense]|uniref:hypothetical protein n=1 Tax=Agrobacterium pusense TaxID=648995 RepID=UPI00157219D8|nr:hypothetical protein [Agrobacterium pusense]NTE46860.1 hypothetical protein [Agrobacterium pusense]